MEKIISVDERIRRAEELYNKRKMQGGVRVSTNNVNNSSRSGINLLKRMIIRIIICVIIYFIFYILKNLGMFFSKDIINQTQKIMSYDINFNQAYSQVIKLYNENMVAKTKEVANEEEKKSEEMQKEIVTDIENEEQQTPEIQQEPSKEDDININQGQSEVKEMDEEQLGIGGADTDEKQLDIIESELVQVSEIQKTQMEIDAEYIKSNFSLIKPAQGIVTSRFGPRESTQIISANHKGIDIGANTGTPIYAAVEGIVTNISNYGDYGKHIYIKNGDLITLYAHCSKINVNTGQYITQGQKIAEIGSTGRTTGPHLHFEIQLNDRIINPEYIIDF